MRVTSSASAVRAAAGLPAVAARAWSCPRRAGRRSAGCDARPRRSPRARRARRARARRETGRAHLRHGAPFEPCHSSFVLPAQICDGLREVASRAPARRRRVPPRRPNPPEQIAVSIAARGRRPRHGEHAADPPQPPVEGRARRPPRVGQTLGRETVPTPRGSRARSAGRRTTPPCGVRGREVDRDAPVGETRARPTRCRSGSRCLASCTARSTRPTIAKPGMPLF